MYWRRSVKADNIFWQVSYVWENLLNYSLCFSKIATLLLFRRLFAVSRTVEIAIWTGVVLVFLIYASGVLVTSIIAAPRIGQSWDSFAMESLGASNALLVWAVTQGMASTFIDLYIFILPLPIIFGLHLSTAKKLRIAGIFFVGLL